MKQRNIYDNKEFFEGYQSLKDSLSVNAFIEIPQLFKLITRFIDTNSGRFGHEFNS